MENYINITVEDATGGRKPEQVEVPPDAPVNRLIVLLVERLHFPKFDPVRGTLVSYKLQHRNTGSQLLDDQTLAQAGVKDGDRLTLAPEIAPGDCRASL